MQILYKLLAFIHTWGQFLSSNTSIVQIIRHYSHLRGVLEF